MSSGLKLQHIDGTGRWLASVASKERLLWRDQRTLAILEIMPTGSLSMQENLQTAGKRLGNLYLWDRQSAPNDANSPRRSRAKAA
jgi:hypothetical protein